MSYDTYVTSTTAGSSYGLTIAPKTSESKPRTPSGLVVTQAVQTRDGWLGQVIVDREIVWESVAEDDGDDAIQAANTRVVLAFKTLFDLVTVAETAEAEAEAEAAS